MRNTAIVPHTTLIWYKYSVLYLIYDSCTNSMSYIFLFRHGESRWNVMNKFSGCVDVPLSEIGMHEAMISSEKIRNIKIDVAFTSHLIRAQSTMSIMLADQKNTGIFLHEDHRDRIRYQVSQLNGEIPVHNTATLNERYYGLLQGMKKHEAAKKYGKEKVLEWRRGWNTRPPKGESLKDVYRRVVPYYHSHILPHVKKNHNILIVAHGNTLRAIIKYMENISDNDIARLELAPAQPFIYKHSKTGLKRTVGDLNFDRPIYWQMPSKNSQ